MFRFAQKGDEVWDIRYGWGKISNMKGAHPHGSYQFVAGFLPAWEILKELLQ